LPECNGTYAVSNSRLEFTGVSIFSVAALSIGIQLIQNEVVKRNTLESTSKYDAPDSIQDKVDLMNQLEKELNEIEHEMNSIKESNAEASIKQFDEHINDESNVI
jgi:hypothetical protein